MVVGGGHGEASKIEGACSSLKIIDRDEFVVGLRWCIFSIFFLGFRSMKIMRSPPSRRPSRYVCPPSNKRGYLSNTVKSNFIT